MCRIILMLTSPVWTRTDFHFLVFLLIKSWWLDHKVPVFCSTLFSNFKKIAWFFFCLYFSWDFHKIWKSFFISMISCQSGFVISSRKWSFTASILCLEICKEKVESSFETNLLECSYMLGNSEISIYTSHLVDK